MKREARKKFILELNDKINEYVHEKALFCGGCCYSAYLLAGIFERMGIKYEVLLFQAYSTVDERNFSTAVEGECDHVAIDVRMGRKHFIIGDYSKIMSYYDKFKVKHAIRRYKGISPSMLFQAYSWNEWNCIYKTSNNSALSRSLNEIAAKYDDGAQTLRKAA